MATYIPGLTYETYEKASHIEEYVLPFPLQPPPPFPPPPPLSRKWHLVSQRTPAWEAGGGWGGGGGGSSFHTEALCDYVTILYSIQYCIQYMITV